MSECVFCNMTKDDYILENDHAFCIEDKHPVNKGHILVIPKRHFDSYFDIRDIELLAINDMIKQLKNLLDMKYEPDGYNIGVNVGLEAGQTIFHLHFHIIPRYQGDVEKPAGGIRNFKEPLVQYQ